MFFSLLSYPCKNLLLQRTAHIEQCSKFVQELLKNKNRTTSDIIGHFYGRLFF